MMTNKPTLALADDDEHHAVLVSTWLELQGYHVVRFGSGDELVTWAEREDVRVDGFVLDVDMPGRDGYQSRRDLQAMPHLAGKPAVFVSAADGERHAAGQEPGRGEVFIRKDGQMLVRLSRWLTDHVYVAS